MRELKKYFRIPPRKVMLTYGISGGVLLAVFVILYLTIGKTLTEFISDTDAFKLWLSSYKGLSSTVFVLIRAFQTVVKIIPAEPLEIAAGYAFGTWGGLLLCSLGTLLGSIVIVVLSRTFGKKFVEVFINEEQFNQLSLISNRKNQRLFLAVFYLVPATPKDIMTYIYATANNNLTEFFIITTICRIPSIITSTICGSQLEQHNIKIAAAVFIATAFVSVVCTLLYKKYNSHSEKFTLKK